MDSDRRKNSRRSPSMEAYVALGKRSPKVGSIKDISLSGLSFQYMADDNEYQEILPKLDIFVLNDKVKVTDVSCNVVYDIPLTADDRNFTFDSGLMNRRCGLQFDGLDNEQAEQVKRLIGTMQQAQGNR